MTLDHCPAGHFLGSFDGRCAECLRDAAMWSAFVHELRAEVAEARMALDVSADDLRAVSYVVCAGNKDAARRVFDAIVAARDACRRAPHAEHSDRVLAKLRAMTPEESRRTFIDAGIFDESGNLTEPYRG